MFRMPEQVFLNGMPLTPDPSDAVEVKEVKRVDTWRPLSVREGGWRTRLKWRSKLLRERVALRLAPWLEP